MRMLISIIALAVVGGSALLVSGCGGSDDTAAKDEQAIRAEFDQFSVDVKSKDLDGIMSIYAADGSLVAFDAFPPRQYVGAAAYRKAYEGFFTAFPGPVTSKVSDLEVETDGDLAYAHGIDRWVATGADGKPVEVVFRFTEVLRKIDGNWLIVHEHLSLPVDPVTGMGDFLSKP